MSSTKPFLKAQAALEFLMTYGWAILIVVIVVGALFALGLTSPCRWVGTQIREFADFKVENPRFDTTAYTLEFDLTRLKPDSVTLTSMTVAGDAIGSLNPVLNNSNSNSTKGARHKISQLTSTKAANDCYSVDVTLNYQVQTASGVQTFSSAGKISGIAQ
jgi:hypothetical protein